MNWYLEALNKKYALFTGRARRQEYWMFVLFNLIATLGLGIIEDIAGITPPDQMFLLPNLYSLAVAIPSTAVGVRRMHDTNRSGWWLLLPIVNILFLVEDSQPGDNQYGPNPKTETTT